MTNERKKAILTLGGTLIIGILVGMLLPGLVHKINGRGYGRHSGDRMEMEHKKEWFKATIYRIIEPDSVQAKQIKPIANWAAAQIDSVENSSNGRLAAILDSVKIKLKPIVSEEQFKRLDEFDSKAKRQWHGKRGHGMRGS